MKEKNKVLFSNKRNILIFIVILIVVIVGVCLIIFNNKEPVLFAESDWKKFEREYESLNGKLVEGNNKNYPDVNIVSNNKVKYFTIEEFLTLMKNREDAVIYFGYETCLYCRSAIEVLVNVAVDTELDEILYINVEDYWDVLELDENDKVITKKEAHSKYYEMLDILGDELVEDYILENPMGDDIKTGKKRIATPLVVFITYGEISSYRIGTSYSQKNPFKKLTESQVEGLERIYSSGINDVIDSKKNKGIIK